MSSSNVSGNQESSHAAKRRKWLGLPVLEPVHGNLGEVVAQLPQFGRQPFAMPSVNGNEIALNPYLDMVYRMQSRQGEQPVPIGVVSKNYRLVDHHHVLRTVEEVLAESEIDTAELDVQGEWTVHGERARFSLILPSDDRFSIALSEEDEMRFRIEVFNSVEGSCRLMVVAGWLRFVCSNGLILGTALMRLRQQHRQQLQIEELGRLLREAIESVDEDQNTVARWREMRITDGDLAEWVDEDVKQKWGIKAGVRVLAIASTGWDGDPKGDLKNKRPSDVGVERTVEVPGIVPPVKDAFGLSQALTWVAGQRSELQEDLEWRGHVPELMQLLLKRTLVSDSLFGR